MSLELENEMLKKEIAEINETIEIVNGILLYCDFAPKDNLNDREWDRLMELTDQIQAMREKQL